jgi:hypothetical protein
MANDSKSHGLYCQKCRTPIDIDASIDQLNPAAFKLLTGMSTCLRIIIFLYLTTI